MYVSLGHLTEIGREFNAGPSPNMLRKLGQVTALLWSSVSPSGEQEGQTGDFRRPPQDRKFQGKVPRGYDMSHSVGGSKYVMISFRFNLFHI